MNAKPTTGDEKMQSSPSTASAPVNSPNLKVMFPIFILTLFFDFGFLSDSADDKAEHQKGE